MISIIIDSLVIWSNYLQQNAEYSITKSYQNNDCKPIKFGMKLRDSTELKSPVGGERKGIRNFWNKIRCIFFCHHINLFVSSKEHLILMKTPVFDWAASSTSHVHLFKLWCGVSWFAILKTSRHFCLYFELKFHHFCFIHNWSVRAWVILSPV